MFNQRTHDEAWAPKLAEERTRQQRRGGYNTARLPSVRETTPVIVRIRLPENGCIEYRLPMANSLSRPLTPGFGLRLTRGYSCSAHSGPPKSQGTHHLRLEIAAQSPDQLPVHRTPLEEVRPGFKSKMHHLNTMYCNSQSGTCRWHLVLTNLIGNCQFLHVRICFQTETSIVNAMSQSGFRPSRALTRSPSDSNSFFLSV
jgi:hypothetical protein